MKSKIAIKIMLCLVFAMTLFHLGIIVKIIPYEITWGGRLKTDSEMYVFEFFSILINLFLFSMLLLKGKYVREFVPMKMVDITLWIFLMLFGLNTVGNILAKTNFEKSFALLTLSSAILIRLILRNDKKRIQ